MSDTKQTGVNEGSSASFLPLIAHAIGDPAGISPELTARMLVDEQIEKAARLVIIGDARVLASGFEAACISLPPGLKSIKQDSIGSVGTHVLVDQNNLDPATIKRGEVSFAGGRSALHNFVTALEMARDNKVDAVTFSPFNKQAMRLARPGYNDEIGVVSEVLNSTQDGREFNILEGLWNARVTSHIPISAVASHMTREAITEAARLADFCMRKAGIDAPRIAVAGLNPHAGDGGSFGMEEIDTIAPAVTAMQGLCINASGPIPADTVFVRASRGEFDAVLTMYHDQGQIAMKLLGFEQGVTFMGGYQVPICTPAHGTAYDIAGQGKADPRATHNSIMLAVEMATRNKQ